MPSGFRLGLSLKGDLISLVPVPMETTSVKKSSFILWNLAYVSYFCLSLKNQLDFFAAPAAADAFV